MPKRGPGLVALVSSIFMVAATATRILLWVLTPTEAGLTLPLLLKAAATGVVFDLATLSYALLPLAIYLLLVPRRFKSKGWHSLAIRLLFTLFTGVLIFTACAEYLFFDEFGTRFNFIAVDYLVYSREVVGNIRESYPVAAIFSGIIAGALGLTWLLRKRLDQAAVITIQGTCRRTGLLLVAAPLVTLACINVSQSAFSSNNFANELAGNGIYNLWQPSAIMNSVLPASINPAQRQSAGAAEDPGRGTEQSLR